jgi:diguanylate cyclase (GGDEF)-like protein
MPTLRTGLANSTLQRVLVIPFVILVLCLAGVIYWASHRSGESAGREFSREVLLSMVERVNQATERYLQGARVALHAVAPDPVYSPSEGTFTTLQFDDDLDRLEQRMWVATGFFPTTNDYVYFAGADGRFVGVNRRPDRIELRLQERGGMPRNVYSMSAPGRRLGIVRSDNYDARSRPWFKNAAANGKESWSAVYTDFTTLEPTFTLTKPVYAEPGTNGDKALIGVAATDLSLRQLTDFFQSLTISRNGVAFIVERSGAVIATSTNEKLYRLQDKALVRLMAEQSASPLLRQAYANVMHWQQSGASFERPMSREFDGDEGKIQVGATLLRDPAGLEWTTIVAVPRSDFIGNVASVLFESLAIGLVAVFMVLVLGFSLLQWVLRDIRKLTRAAQSIGQGEPLEPLNIQRGDEIGQLAKSFQEMERNLRTDKLTGVLNRESLIAQIEFRRRNGTGKEPLRFTLLFVDLDRFKQVNDEHGHDAGDKVLIEITRRLKAALRGYDDVARFGGDEFVVYLHGIDNQRAIDAVCEKLRMVVELPIDTGGGLTVEVGASIGVAKFPSDGSDIDTLMKVADMRMFNAKKAGKAELQQTAS